MEKSKTGKMCLLPLLFILILRFIYYLSYIDRFDSLDNSCWRPNSYVIAWNVPRYYRAGPNGYPVTYSDTRHDHSVTSNPAIIPNCHFFREVWSRSSRPYVRRVRRCEDTHVWSELHAITNFHNGAIEDHHTRDVSIC